MDQQIDMDVVKTNKKLSKPLSKGFTIVELIIVIVIIGILTTIATPLMNDWAKESRVKTSADDFVAFLEQARNVSYQTSSPVIVQAVNNNWSDGFDACVNSCADIANIVATTRLRDTTVISNLGDNAFNFRINPNGFITMPAAGVPNIFFAFCTFEGNNIHRRVVALGPMGSMTVTAFNVTQGNECNLNMNNGGGN
jgi:prepilin-type N-terminal cleavage/methylation domain-containing protein